MSVIKKFSKDTLIYGFGSGLKKFIGLILLPFYTRALTPADYGILDTLGSFVFLIITFLNFGLDTASGYYYFKVEEKNEKGKILFTVMMLRLVVTIPMLILMNFVNDLSLLLFDSEKYSSVLLITLMLIPANMLMSEQSLIYRFNRKAWGYNILVLLKSFINIIGGILLVVKFEFGVFGAQLAALISTTLVILYSYLNYTRKIYTYKFSFNWAKRLLNFGFPLIWAGMAVWVYSMSDRFFLLHYKDTTQIGLYSIGSTFSQPLGLLNMAIQMSFGVLFWDIFHKEKSENKTESKKLMSDVVKIYVSIAVFLMVILSVFSYEIINFFATSKYLGGIIVIPILLSSKIYAQIIQIIPVGISISEKTWHYTWIIIVAALVNIGLNFWFIPEFGFFGAAITTLVAYFVYYALSDVISMKFYNSKYPRWRVNIVIALALVISLFFPIEEIYFQNHYEFYYKILFILTGISLPFLFRLINIHQVKIMLFNLLTKK